MVDFLFAPEDQQAPPVTPKTQQLFACISGRTQELMRKEVHASQKQVCLCLLHQCWAFCPTDAECLHRESDVSVRMADAHLMQRGLSTCSIRYPQVTALTIIAKSFATLCIGDEALLDNIASRALALLDAFAPQVGYCLTRARF